MRRPSVVPALGLVLLAAIPTGASAQLWSNGTFDGFSALTSERNTVVADSRVYDNFVVSGSSWFVTSFFGDYSTDFTASTAYWEIRSGITAGLGGTLLFSGTDAVVGVTDLGDAFGYNRVMYTIGGFSPFVLGPGEYWLTIAPVGDGSGRAFLNTTDGSNGINAVTDGQFFWDSPTFGADFTDVMQDGSSSDFAYGLNGTSSQSVVPEPSSAILLGTGLGVFALVGWRRRRRMH